MTRFDDVLRLIREKHEEHETQCAIIAEREYNPGYRGHHEARDRVWRELQDLEIERAEALAGEAAIEFLREWAPQIALTIGPGFPEVCGDLSRVRERVSELDELRGAR